MDRYIIIRDFIRWCEATERTEWIGYLHAFERVYAEYMKDLGLGKWPKL